MQFHRFILLAIVLATACGERAHETDAGSHSTDSSRGSEEKSDTGIGAHSDGDGDSDTDSDSDGDSDPDTDSDADADSETDEASNRTSDSNTNSAPGTDNADTQPASDTADGPETGTDSDFDAGIESGTDTRSEDHTASGGTVSLGQVSDTDTADCGEKGDLCGGPCGPCTAFDFKSVLFGSPTTLSIHVSTIDSDGGTVTIDGVDGAAPSVPFDFDWGDGEMTTGWFPSSHTYLDTGNNPIVTVTAHYPDDTQTTASTLVRFEAPNISPVSLPSELSVSIPNAPVTLAAHFYDPPQGLSYFDDTFFSRLPRASAEYVLSVAAALQHEFANGDVFLVEGAFHQVVLRAPSASGMYSLWYASPVAFGCGDYGFSGTPEYSSFFHEMGHNVSLNSPAEHYFGGRIDGNANAIYSETMAQIFQHATTYTLLNTDGYGMSDDLLFEIEQGALASMGMVRSAYDAYRSSGNPFASWNNPDTTDDETVLTFMTIAYKFFEQAETRETGYRLPLKRMMALLQTFDADLESRYDRLNNTQDADAFRATLMVAAVSYAFDRDLRADFTELNFPIDDDIYAALMARL